MPLPRDPDPVDAPANGLVEAVFARLSAAILDETLLPDEVLVEADLSRWLGASRTPVRAALARLEHLGLVQRSASRTLTVTSVGPELEAATLEHSGYQAGISMHMALQRMSDAELDEACALLDPLVDANAADDTDALYASARRFFGFIAVHAGNPVHLRMMRESGVALERNLRAHRPTIGDAAFRARLYGELLERMRARDAAGAERVIRHQHLIPDPAPPA